jgi:hypothetical protein
MWHLALTDIWEAAKSALVPNDGNVRALVHVHAAVAAYLVMALFARRGFAAFWPAGVVCALTLANEAIDLSSLPDLSQSWVWRDTGGDIANSVVWPLAIMVVARWLSARNQGAPTEEGVPVDPQATD